MGIFSINTEVSSNSIKPNTIHNVTFQGVEAKEVGTEKKYKVLELKFQKEDGSKFSHSIFAPQTKKDMERQPNTFGGESPSLIEQINETIRQLLAAIVPDFYAKLKAKDAEAMKQYNPTSWDTVCSQLAKLVNPKIGTATQIKLLCKSDGATPVMPGFPLAINKNGGVYVATTMIGNELAFTKKEMEKIANSATSAPKKSKMPSENAIQIPDVEDEDISNDVDNDLPSDDDLPF